ncbi:hypothetical protein VTN96DRAFT_4304 [Rasamsonia emersonii]
MGFSRAVAVAVAVAVIVAAIEELVDKRSNESDGVKNRAEKKTRRPQKQPKIPRTAYSCLRLGTTQRIVSQTQSVDAGRLRRKQGRRRKRWGWLRGSNRRMPGVLANQGRWEREDCQRTERLGRQEGLEGRRRMRMVENARVDGEGVSNRNPPRSGSGEVHPKLRLKAQQVPHGTRPALRRTTRREVHRPLASGSCPKEGITHPCHVGLAAYGRRFGTDRRPSRNDVEFKRAAISPP